MKFNKWTLGLAAVGAVSLTSAVTARADGGNLTPVEAALSGVTITGGVDTSIEWAVSPHQNDWGLSPGDDIPFREDKQDGFNLNVVELNIGKALGEGEWDAGFLISLIMGPDATFYNEPFNGGGGSGFTIKQAYVNLRTPVGNGIDWKIGSFSTIIGYEVFESWKNPNFTRSWGYTIEPTEHTGVLGSYQFTDSVSVSFGIANTLHSGINTRNDDEGLDSYWCKTYMGSIALTAPESMGVLAGSTLYAGIVSGWNDDDDDQFNLYLGAVINTPVTGLTTGVAFDYAHAGNNNAPFGNDEIYVAGLYASYRATEKLSFHGRSEYGWWNDSGGDGCFWGLTGTIQYDLWANVLSRLELRFENDDDAGYTEQCALLLAANIVYTF